VKFTSSTVDMTGLKNISHNQLLPLIQPCLGVLAAEWFSIEKQV
jgi:hypothetical protein